MKKLVSLLLIAAFTAPAPLLRAAADPTPVSVVTFIGANPTFDDAGKLVAAPVQALYRTTVVVAGQSYAQQESVTWDGTGTGFTVTAAGLTATPAQITALARAAADYVKAHPDFNTSIPKTP